MIVKKNLNLLKAVPYVWLELTLGLVLSVVVYLVYEVADEALFSIPNLLPGVLGAALAIFLGFRDSAAYGRWGEAAQLLASIGNTSRTCARLIVTFSESHKHTESYRAEAVQLFQREIIYRQMAWVNILRITLRGEAEWESDAKPFLIHDGDLECIQHKNNKCAALLILQGHCIYDAMRSGTLQGFDSLQLEGHMAQLSTLESQCVRFKNNPIPRQYTFFTRLFVWLFIVTMPFSFLPIFDEASRSWLVIPVTLVFAFVYGIMERTGAVNEDPFENLMTGVPMNAFCIEIESDSRETLQETVLPELPKITKNGYLY